MVDSLFFLNKLHQLHPPTPSLLDFWTCGRPRGPAFLPSSFCFILSIPVLRLHHFFPLSPTPAVRRLLLCFVVSLNLLFSPLQSAHADPDLSLLRGGGEGGGGGGGGGRGVTL